MLGVGIRLYGGIKMQNRWVSAIIAGILALPCYAATYETDNEGGGKIVLTDRECKNYPPLRSMYAYHSTGVYMDGCWAIIDGKVHVYYHQSKERRVYPAEIFHETKTY